MPSLKVVCWGAMEKLFARHDSFLSRDDCEVLLASSAREVLKLAQRSRPKAILIDQDLAGNECERLCRSLNSGRHTKEIPVVVITSEEASVPAAGQMGAAEVLHSPNSHEISQALARAVGVAARKYPRFPVEAPARVRTQEESGEIDSRALDISLEGVQLEVDQPLQLGCEVSVSLTLPVDSEPLTLRATVVRILADPIWGRNRLGLQFLMPDDETRTRLQHLLRRLAEVEEKLAPSKLDEPRNRYIF